MPQENDPVREWLAARAKVDAAKAEADAASAELLIATEAMLSHFEHTGQSLVRADGYTVFLERKMRVSAREGRGPMIVDAFLALDMPEMVPRGYNAARLEAWVKELEASDTAVPDVLVPHIHLYEQFNVKRRKSAK